MALDAHAEVQSALEVEGAAAGMSMEWDLRGDAQPLWATLSSLAREGVVIGVGAPLLQAVGAQVAGLLPYARLVHGRHALPETQHALWTLVLGAGPGVVFEQAEQLKQALSPFLRLAEATSLFSYRSGRDLTGYRDGSANPEGDAAREAALIADGPLRAGSFALVQRWLHFRERFQALPVAQRDRVIGRTLEQDEEMDDAPPSAHIKRTEQEDFDPPAFMLRRSMPWGDARRHGLQFIAFMSDLGKSQAMLERMLGLSDGIADALLEHSQAETGAYYLVPPVREGRLVLPGSPGSSSSPHEAADTEPEQDLPVSNLIRLRENGALALEGNFCVAGEPQRRAELCRCGASLRKPYCDGSHSAAGFTAAGELARLPLPPASAAGGRVDIQPIADGPLVVCGTVELLGAGDAVTRFQTGPTLCRCGQSANKPYCDGSHARTGFRAPD